MNKLIDFFLKNVHLNHLMLAFLLISGIYAYIKIPKELFPDVMLDKITISGAYAGTSATTLDKMAVRDIEDDVGGINGIQEIDSVITPGQFAVILTLDKSAEPDLTLDKVKDAIANVRQYLPADMNEPVAKVMDHNRDLIKLAVSSDTIGFDELLREAKKVRSYLLKMPHISEVDIYGDSDKKIEVKIDSEALKAYNLNPSEVINTISNLSYTYPIGNIDDEEKFIFVSTVNGKEDVEEWGKTLLHIGEHYLYLNDIAKVKIYHPQDVTLSSYDGKKSLTLSVSKDMTGDSIWLAKELQKEIKEYGKQYKTIDFEFYNDHSIPVKNRLDVIISNLTLGLILIFLTMYFLINRNTAIVVTLGIPFSFIIGLLFLYNMGYSLNIVSLIGAILVVGIAVDDAVVVSENIQRHIDEGMEPSDAALAGAKEMMLPVTLATLTTVVAFMPMFMLSGEMGLFIKLIPVVVIMVLLGSLLESFFFLPLHAKTLLKKNTPSRDWSRWTDLYERILHYMLHYKKTTLAIFFIAVPLMTLGTLKMLHFQFFPSFDGDKLYITGKLNINTSLEKTYAIAEEINAEVLMKKEELFVKTVSQLSGRRKNLAQEWVRGSNMFYITLELHDMVDTNFVNKYINPVLDLSFNFNDPSKIRTLYSYELAEELRKILKKYESKYQFEEFAVMERKVGLIKTDIEINLIGSNDAQIEASVLKLKAGLADVSGVNEIVDNVRYGKSEYKIKINSYGEQLGLSEGYVASILSGYFLGNRKALSFDDDGVVEITTEFSDKDNISKLVNFDLPLGNGRFVQLNQVAEFIEVQDYEMIVKENGSIVKTVSANVDKAQTTSIQVLEKIRPLLDEIGEDGITVHVLGEQEKNEQLKRDMLRAVGMALFLMLILLLFIFPKIKYALMILSVIPFSIFGGLFGHLIMGMNIAMPSVIGLLGLAGVVINDGIIMLDFLHGTHDTKAFYKRAKQRLRPIIITSVTTFIGLSTLIFFATGQAKIMQPLAISLGFGLLWGTVVNLLYLPTLYAMVNKIRPESEKDELQTVQNQTKAMKQ
ncbi:MAG: efflux RND transporter permease subunit [Campylobacterota bacterium]|nr:efflux RND transporter permease subunit [Campylobacterota bacterium]